MTKYLIAGTDKEYLNAALLFKEYASWLNIDLSFQHFDEELKKFPTLGATTSLISHTSTGQKSLRLTIPGKSKPEEIVVLGAHLDSIKVNFLGMPTSGRSPSRASES